ncbi:MAG: pyridoxal-phosphate dependent enzyme [Gaiellaceae bacterium]
MTPLERAPAALGAREIYLKREDLHELGAFKWRGALPVLREYRAAGATTVVTASTGNHGAATAWAARELGLDAIVFAPEQATETKLSRIRALGAELRQTGADFDEAKAAASAYAKEYGLPLFVDGAEPAQFDGYRAIGEEIARESNGRPGTVIVPVGNGALIGGVGEALASSGWQVVGVVAKDAPVMADSFDARAVREAPSGATIADGLAVRVAIPYAVGRIQPVVEQMVRVSERELALAIGRFAQVGIRVEASAAASLAALDYVTGVREPVVLVVTGRNIDDELFLRACDAPESFAN